MRLIAVAALGVMLAGCSLFSETHAWTKPGMTAEEAQVDLDTCKEIAWSQQSADEKIDTDTAATMGDPGQGGIDTELSQNMSSQRSGKRYGDIVADCMRQLGYAPAD